MTDTSFGAAWTPKSRAKYINVKRYYNMDLSPGTLADETALAIIRPNNLDLGIMWHQEAVNKIPIAHTGEVSVGNEFDSYLWGDVRQDNRRPSEALTFIIWWRNRLTNAKIITPNVITIDWYREFLEKVKMYADGVNLPYSFLWNYVGIHIYGDGIVDPKHPEKIADQVYEVHKNVLGYYPNGIFCTEYGHPNSQVLGNWTKSFANDSRWLRAYVFSPLKFNASSPEKRYELVKHDGTLTSCGEAFVEASKFPSKIYLPYISK